MQSVATVASSLFSLGTEVHSSLAEARRTHALQLGSTEAATQLNAALAELAEAAHTEMQNITGTALGIRDTLLGHNRLIWRKEVALWVCAVVLRGRLQSTVLYFLFCGLRRSDGWLMVPSSSCSQSSEPGASRGHPGCPRARPRPPDSGLVYTRGRVVIRGSSSPPLLCRARAPE